MTTPKNLSDEIRERLRADERSINAIAKAAGIQQQTLNRFALGQRDLTLGLASQLVPVLGGKLTWKKVSKKG